MAQIRVSQPSDAHFHWEHLRRIVLESGRDGDPIFSPVEERTVTLEDFCSSYPLRFKNPAGHEGWERTWVIADNGGIYGELSLVHRPPIKSCLHRATLMMGIERSHRGRGFGAGLMNVALTWAKAQLFLEWIQLYVFEGNEPAKKLYSRFGFEENGTTPDMFRVHGQKVADTSMVLNLRAVKK